MKKRVLLVTEHDPRSVNYGAGQRTHNIWMALREIADVDVAWFCKAKGNSLLIEHIDNTGIQRIQLPQRSLCDQWWNVCPSCKGKKALNTVMAGQHYDLVVARYITPFLKLGLWHLAQPVLVDYDDPIYRDISDQKHSVKNFIKKNIRMANQYIAGKWLRSLDLSRVRFAFVNNRDAEFFPYLRASVLPNIPIRSKKFNFDTEVKADNGGGVILFVGLMSYAPNSIGVQHFLDKIWPDILNVDPSVVFKIAGKIPEDLKAKWSKYANCEILGFVPDLGLIYQNSTIAISPIYSGGGTNIKVAEAYLYGCPMVISEFTYFGWDNYFQENENIMVGRSAEDFSQKCLTLLKDKNLRNSFSKLGKEIVDSKLSINQYEAFLFSELNRSVL